MNAVRLVAAGDAMLSPSVTRTLLSHFGDAEATERRRAAAQRLATLTDREREVALAVGSGASNAEVAASLFMSEATVKAHVSRLFTKLDVDQPGAHRDRRARRRPVLTPLPRTDGEMTLFRWTILFGPPCGENRERAAAPRWS